MKKLHSVGRLLPMMAAFFILVPNLSFAADTADTMAMEHARYILAYQKPSSVRMIVTLNEVPLDFINSTEDGVSSSGSFNVGQWILPGKNHFRIRMTKNKKATLSDWSEASLILYATTTEDPTEGEKAVDYQWSVEKGDKLPVSVSKSFEVKDAPPSDFWPKAKPITLTQEGKKAVLDLMRSVIDAFSKKDYERGIILTEYGTNEIFRTTYSTPMPREKIVNLYKSIFEGSDMTFRPIDSNKLIFRFIAKRRILLVTYRDGTAAIKAESKDGKNSVGINVLVAPVDGKWTFVRN
ncbi:hypothetical protein HZA43_03085 [Candidatus Peregrinibacteria bacterium]|nr:hypothetical protein [Candidatus Peregrinibacteria bacterium]